MYTAEIAEHVEKTILGELCGLGGVVLFITEYV
jgi:hypothetical protein